MPIDLLHLARSLRRSPVSAGAAILTLSLTLGAGASIVAVVDALLLTPPPFTDPDALVTLGQTPVDDPAAPPRAVPYATFDAWRDRAESLAALEAFDGTNLTLTELGAAERMSATDVTPGFLTLLGVTPALGRTFGPDDVAQPVVIVSHTFWRGRLGADPAVVGRRIVLGGQTHTIVGVLREPFAFELNPADIWRPLPLTPAQASRTGYRVRAIARLASGVAPGALTDALDQVGRSSAPRTRAVATGIATAIAGDSTDALALLAGAAALAMVIAFTNLAGLLIVRSIDRRRELAVRTALGAHRSEVVKQLLLESVSLVTLGTAGGVLLAWWMTPAIGELATEQLGGLAQRDVTLSWRAIAVVTTVAFACAGVCGWLPGIGAARWRVSDVLRRGATPSMHETTLRRIFVTAEVALAFVLLVSLALLGRTLLAVLEANPGFDARGLLTLQVSLPRANYPADERVAGFYSALQDALGGRLGTRAVSTVDEIPLTGDRGRSLVAIRRTENGSEAVVRTASPSYFDVMRIPVIAGRSFEPQDDSTVAPRVVISELLARSVFGVDSPVGRSVWLAAAARFVEVIGVAGDVTHRAIDEERLPTIYLSALQFPSPSSILVVRRTIPEAQTIAAVREEVARLDATIPVYRIRSMPGVVAVSPGVPARRLLTTAFTGFAVLAIVLSSIGLFGVAAHDVACRRAEIALRVALGANPMRILGATLRQSALMLGAGLAVGGVLSIWATRGLSSIVFTTGLSDVVGIGAAALVLMAAGAGAVLPVALRASRTEPLAALRAE